MLRYREQGLYTISSGVNSCLLARILSDVTDLASHCERSILVRLSCDSAIHAQHSMSDGETEMESEMLRDH